MNTLFFVCHSRRESASLRFRLRKLDAIVVTLCLLLVTTLRAQSPQTSIDTYIHNSWDTLTRSMSDCKSVVDIKVTTTPILYLPFGMATPPEVAAMQQQCSVQVAHLPRRITKMGDVQVAEIPMEGLLYLPRPYVVPGGRFNEMYGWDSYFILLGLVQDGRVERAKDIVENFFFEIENYGAVLNANRTYYFTRSQPPFLSSMIAEVYNRTHDKAWLARAYGYATRDHKLWTGGNHLAGTTGLARYDDIGSGPANEMADDSTYYPDVIHYLLAHPETKTNYLVTAPEHPDAKQSAALNTTSCDLASKVCAAAYADGHRLSAAYYHGDRAMRESGFDTSFRFGPFSGSTEQYAPICLNSLLYKYERDMAHFAAELGKPSEAAAWNAQADTRRATINRLLWQADKGLFYDYNFVTAKPSTYNYVTTFYPLWSGLATPEQAVAVEQHLPIFEHDGGLAMSPYDSGTQWDLPYGWAPTNWLPIQGLAQYGFQADATRLAHAFMRSVETNYATDGTIREKYNVVSADANVKVAAGYKANVIGFGWTNGVYLKLEALSAGSPIALPGTTTILTHDQLEKFVPATVFFAGQTATVQLRNAAGLRLGDGAITFAVKVDTGGYASSIQERYQDYFVTEEPIGLGDKLLPAGAYGIGFVAGNFIVMNIGGQEVFSIPSQTDATLKRPMPLQIIDDLSSGTYRLYSGRSYISLHLRTTR